MVCVRSNRSPFFYFPYLYTCIICTSCVCQLLNKRIYDDDDESLVLSTKLVDGRARGGLMHKVYYTLVDHKVLTPLLLFVVDLYSSSLQYVMQHLARFRLT